MNYHHLTIEERSCIRKYYVDGLSYREIARLIRQKRQHGVAGRYAATAPTCTTSPPTTRTQPNKKYLLRRSYCHRRHVAVLPRNYGDFELNSSCT